MKRFLIILGLCGVVFSAWWQFSSKAEGPSVSDSMEEERAAFISQKEKIREMAIIAGWLQEWATQNKKVTDAVYRDDVMNLKGSLRLRQVAEEQLVTLGVDMVPLKNSAFYIPDNSPEIKKVLKGN